MYYICNCKEDIGFTTQILILLYIHIILMAVMHISGNGIKFCNRIIFNYHTALIISALGSDNRCQFITGRLVELINIHYNAYKILESMYVCIWYIA